MRVISLGWGVQSFALAAMSALGELPLVDAAIHSDTTHERSETYEFAEKWTPWLEARGVRVVTVKNSTDFPNGSGVFIPAYTVCKATGDRGMLLRTCTQRWKIAPIRRWLQANRNGEPVEQWIGYTQDEVERAKPSNVQYIANAHPFLEYGMQRWQVEAWLGDNSLDIPVKSGCVFCPYHGAPIWHEIKKNPRDWRNASSIDARIRSKRPDHSCYLTTECVELPMASFNTQLSLWNEECEGHCFL